MIPLTKPLVNHPPHYRHKRPTIVTRLRGNPTWGWTLRIGWCSGATFRNLIADLKTNIPPRSRRWNRGDKSWYVKPEYGNTLYEILDAHGIDAEWDEVSDDLR